MWSMQEDRQCVAEVATLAKVGIALVLCLQEVCQGQHEYLFHLWAGGREREWTEDWPLYPPPVSQPSSLVSPYSPPRDWA